MLASRHQKFFALRDELLLRFEQARPQSLFLFCGLSAVSLECFQLPSIDIRPAPRFILFLFKSRYRELNRGDEFA